MTQIVSLPFYQQRNPLAPAIVQARAATLRPMFRYKPAHIRLPWALESLKGSLWANIYTGELHRIWDVTRGKDQRDYPIIDKCYPPQMSSIGIWDSDDFVILDYIRLDAAPPKAAVLWYLFWREFLERCLADLDSRPEHPDLRQSLHHQRQKRLLLLQYRQTQRVIGACLACIN